MVNVNLYKSELDEIRDIVKSNLPFEMTGFGKMIRSKIGILLLKSLGIEPDKRYLSFLASIELIHNASLLQDDVIDNSLQRRGSENIKSKTNDKVSVVYSDILIVNAIRLLPEQNRKELLDIILVVISDMCKGELIQYSQTNTFPTIDEYLEKSRLKTAVLFKGMIEGLCAISDDIIPVEYRRFGEDFGIAFQLKNDLEDILTTNTDKTNGVYTAGYIYSGTDELTKTSLEKTLSLKDNYIDKSIEDLSDLKESIYKEELIGVVRCLKN